MCASNEKLTEYDVWTNVFPPFVDDVPVKDYITQSVFPRPRDVIVLAKEALSLAISRGHEKITPDDLKDARLYYSNYAVKSVAVEDSCEVSTIEPAIFALIGQKEILSDDELRNTLRNELDPKEQIDSVIDLMCRLSILGVEISTNTFTYINDDTDSRRILKLASVHSARTNRRRYKIHSALCPALGTI